MPGWLPALVWHEHRLLPLGDRWQVDRSGLSRYLGCTTRRAADKGIAQQVCAHARAGPLSRLETLQPEARSVERTGVLNRGGRVKGARDVGDLVGEAGDRPGHRVQGGAVPLIQPGTRSTSGGGIGYYEHKTTVTLRLCWRQKHRLLATTTAQHCKEATTTGNNDSPALPNLIHIRRKTDQEKQKNDNAVAQYFLDIKA
uniref:Uncharacterized protein n=1 Tax=Timema bartmani TaxID=61472 RepID=A0A7R9EWX5_9NEOP|nr:unnamed protein product [Timema bartmani]